MIDPKTLVERELDSIRRELRELAYNMGRVLSLLAMIAEEHRRGAQPPVLADARLVDPHGLFAKAQAETQGRVLEEPVIPPDSVPEKPKPLRVSDNDEWYYIRRDGTVVGPARRTVGGHYVVSGRLYEENGRSLGWGAEYPYDLIDYA